MGEYGCVYVSVYVVIKKRTASIKQHMCILNNHRSAECWLVAGDDMF
jgi:hypothetical protein